MPRILVGTLCWAMLLSVNATPQRRAACGPGSEGARQDPAGDLERTPIAKLIEQLAHPSFRVREAAGQELRDRADEALPALRDARRHASPEVRHRVAVLTQSIEREVLFSAKRLSIQMKNRPIKEIVEEIARQTGYTIQSENLPDKNCTLDMADGSYWQAIDQLCLEMGLVYSVNEPGGAVQLYHQNTYSPYTHNTGPFRVVASGVHSSRSINLAYIPRNGIQNQNAEYLNISMEICSEPRVPLLSVGAPTLTEAIDEDGNSLIPKTDANNPYVAGYGMNMYLAHQHSTQIPLQRRTRDSRKIKCIRGKIPVTVLAEQRPEITVDKLESVKKGDFDGRTVSMKLDKVEINQKTVTANVQITLKRAQPQFDHSWANSIGQRLVVEDAKGNRYYTSIQNYMNMTPQSVHATFSFMPNQSIKDIGPPAKLIYLQWLSMDHEIEFEFRDVPLP